MSLDLRIPMGLLFSFVGVILTAFGLATREDPALYARSLGIDVNLWWGLVLLVFGQGMYHLGRRGHNRARSLPAPAPAKSGARRGH